MKGLAIGRRVEITRAYTAEEIAEFWRQSGVSLTGDASRFAAGEVPGPLLGALFSYLLGTRLPGYGTNYLKQRLVFLTPAHAGQSLTASVEIVRLRPEKELANLRTVCVDEHGEMVCDGEALVLVRDVEYGE